MAEIDLNQTLKELEGGSAEDVLRWSAANLSKKTVFASSLGAEDQVILDMIYRLRLDIPVFTLDTGRLFNETYDLIAESEKKYGLKIKIYFPQSELIEEMTQKNGVNLFKKSVKLRKQCCSVRKLEPLSRALSRYNAWICGLRREQSVTRSSTAAIELDGNGRLKINPLVDWSESDLWDYIRKFDVPYNALHDKSFPSIGCACCTRAVPEGGHVRDGRWWWENPVHKECGLHFKDGKLVRASEAT